MESIVVGYVASRFPEVTQTWMLREMEVVAADPRIECELFSLFPPMKRTGTVHPSAERWMERLRRPGAGAAFVALLWWLVRAPARLVGAIGLVAAGYARHPALLARALVTVAVASAHARSVAAIGVGHLHAHTATYPLLAAWLCHRLTGVSYSFTAHAHDIFMDQSFLRRRLAEAEFGVAISEYNREFLRAYGGDEQTPVHVIRCGIDVSSYRFRSRAPAGEGPLRALAIGGFKDYKGHRYLLEALGGDPELERISLDLVGDGPLREELEVLASNLRLSERVRFHGALTEPRVIALLETADLFVLPSVVTPEGNTEGLPVVLMEALAAGVPVVATRVTGVPELVREGETGLLAEPADPADLRRAIKRLLADPDAARLRCRAGRELVEREYDAAVTGGALAELFAQVAPRTRSAVTT
jgi:glycosyltransferase involved in cell wall biosynthesis